WARLCSSGDSSQRNFLKSSTPAALSVSTTSERSRRLISGNSCTGRWECSSRDQSRRQAPGAVRPARPARWSADDWLIFSISSVLMPRSEEHTSELQSRENLVCRLLLEKKKKIKYIHSSVLIAIYFVLFNLPHYPPYYIFS